jgi:RimJ/RimL family protein N-acetyltransferase
MAFADPLVQRFSWARVAPYTPDDARAFFAAQERRAAVGYWLAAHARGRGVASRAVRLLAGWSFAQLGTARLELTCAPENEASQAVATRCGFTREGVLRSHMVFKGARRDTVMFSLLPGELR